MTYLERALNDGYAEIVDEGKKQRIIYKAVDHSERYSDPEERVRAEFWAELIYRYQYEPQKIGIEITVPDRTPSDRADIVIFRDSDRKRPYAVIECKQDGVSDAEFNQAVEQAYGNGTWAKFRADYVMVVAGATRRVLDCTDKYGALERDKNIVADLPIKYGKPEEYKYFKNTKSDIQPVSKEGLITAIQKCHQTLWGGGRLSPPAAFGELCKILFVKVRDEKKPRKKGQPYEFQIKTHEESRRLAERIRGLYEDVQQKEPEVFTETIKVDDAVIRTLVSHLEGINLNKTDLDTKGVAFEQFMDGFFKGDFGQYFTPREVIEFAVAMMQPTHEDMVLDPACGSGGFLLHALDAIRREASEYYEEDSKEHFKHWHDFAEKRLFGIDINEEITRVAKMNMILHDDGHTNVIGCDALEPIKNITEHNRGFKENSFTLVLTNPPFGSMVKASEKPDGYLSGYEMAHISYKAKKTTKSSPKSGKKAVKTRSSVKTEILFCERVYDFLKSNGRAAIILPDGILTNSSLQGVRDWLLDKFQLLAVVSLPQTAFAHFGAGVKSSVVFLRKRKAEEIPSDDEAIFMAMAENIGYDATGRKTMKVIATEEGDNQKIEIHRCDLFDTRVIYRKDGDEWREDKSEVIYNSGILEQYFNFQQNPTPFFV
ncbi:MAG: N-6 DNA methylase [Xenococcaceae cyanobacterium MO_207.B15]|nr:N-6 DNA methylase [Xenococcaceae cyanobacterium MO_207.B15]